ncbi:plasmid maintenance system antidote protein, XRE family [Desulfonatronospira thiodismutans ASO3-1]|uniref:Plasmid maintenance system antidote protein, XRE family n=1 Tax=Desulfonatronospira thiodismutans ASO3-1 TaxID=555779 RepID=D6SJR3_9BACT|nr:HigA family addiction module antitoxin [Desulfonatronospira thiodismutans]EFI36116.1 plasmid maintenance system antidote protein, XRE family [Desulfonatronospira thiodismutans ASO3-1]
MPMKNPPHPGLFVKAEVLDSLNLSISEAAGLLGVRRATLSALVNQKTSLSPEMAYRIEKAFGVSMDMLLRMQAGFDVCKMRQKKPEIIVKPYKPAGAH